MADSLLICTAFIAKFHYLIWFDIGEVIIIPVYWQTDKPFFCSYNFLINIIVNIHLVFLNHVPQEGLHSLQFIEKPVWWLEQILEVVLLMKAIYDLIQILKICIIFPLMQYVFVAKCTWLFIYVFLSISLFSVLFNLFYHFITLNTLQFLNEAPE